MDKYLDKIIHYYSNAFFGFAYEIQHPSFNSFFYWMVGLSLLFWIIEIVFPWRKKFPVFHNELGINLFYLFFTLFIFPRLFYEPISRAGVILFNKLLVRFNTNDIILQNIRLWPAWCRIVLLFLVMDFLRWALHLMQHRVKWLWELHKLHHSSQTMGIGSGFRGHLIEPFVIGAGLYIPMTMLGFGLQSFFAATIVYSAIGLYGHTNFKINLGPLKYIINNPSFHLWHHAQRQELPKGVHSVNYGSFFCIWDYIFSTAYMPNDGTDISIGFDGVENYPKTFIGQTIEPFVKKNKNRIM